MKQMIFRLSRKAKDAKHLHLTLGYYPSRWVFHKTLNVRIASLINQWKSDSLCIYNSCTSVHECWMDL